MCVQTSTLTAFPEDLLKDSVVEHIGVVMNVELGSKLGPVLPVNTLVTPARPATVDLTRVPRDVVQRVIEMIAQGVTFCLVGSLGACVSCPMWRPPHS